MIEIRDWRSTEAALLAARASGAALGYILVFAVVTCAIAYAAPNVAHLWRFRRYVDAALGVFFIFVGYSIFTHGLS